MSHLLACLLLLFAAVLAQRGAAQAPAMQSLTFPPAADVYVDGGAPAVNFNSSPLLKADASPVRIVYLRFAVSGVGRRPVQQARLRLGVSGTGTSGMSAGGGSVYRVADNTWHESTVTFGSRPAADGAALATLGPVGPGAVADFDVGGTVAGDGVYSFAIDTASTDGVAYVSAAAARGQKPELVLTVPAGSDPTVGIAQPSDGAAFFVGDPITLQASASDPIDGDLGASIAWTSSLRGPLGTGATVAASLGAGSHLVTASVRDHAGLAGSAAITVVVKPAPAVDTEPLVAISAPAGGRTFNAGVPIAFAGSAHDLEDGDLGASISWSSDRDGALGTGGSFSKALSAGVHRITARAVDRGGLPGAATLTVTVIAPTTLEFGATADTYVDARSPTTNFGADPLLRADADVERTIYLRFVVAGVGMRTVTGAVLRLQSDAPSGAASDSGGSVRSISNRTWVESKVTYNTRPAVDGPVLATAGAVAAGQSVDFDVGAAVHGDGKYNLALVNGSTDGADYRSREGGAAPRLLVTVTDDAPVVAITSPPNQGVFLAGSPITFSGAANDADDGDLGARLSWSSSLDGDLGRGSTFTRSTLRVGTHTIRAAVPDAGGHPGEATIGIRVRGPNLPPRVTIGAPPRDGTVPAGSRVTLSATAVDDFDGDLGSRIRWSSNLDGSLGLGPTLAAVLSEGRHTIRAVATDSDGSAGLDAVIVTVAPTPPTVAIAAPADGAVMRTGTAVTFSGTASDATDGDVSRALRWTSSLDGAIGNGARFTTSRLSVGTHVIAAAVTDAGGLSAEARRTLVVQPANTAPTLTIRAPGNGAALLAGRPVLLAADATDTDAGDLGTAVRWTSSRAGLLGTGGRLTVPTLPAGTHVLTASVTDPEGATASASVTVTVAPSTLVFTPIADTYVDAKNANQRFGSSTSLRANASPSKQAFLRFGLSGIGPFAVDGARLRLTTAAATAAASSSGGVVRGIASGTWSEATTAWAKRPPVDGPVLATAGPVSANQKVDFDLSAGIAGDGTYDFAVVTSSTDEVVYQSREAPAAARPQLTVTLRGRAEPRVRIDMPVGGSIVSATQAIMFHAAAVDAQGTDLSSALQWTSSLDGPLGSGPSLTRTLRAGTHTITATTTDAAFHLGSATVVVDVQASSVKGDLGFRDFHYPTSIETGIQNEATASKPESKLWFVDGTWWATLYEQGAGAHRIHRLDPVTQRWVDTGVPVDERPQSRQDVLWDGRKLYMASRFAGSPAQNRLLRYSYDSTAKTFVLNPGFPVKISGGGTESVTLAKDSTGTLWIAYTLGNRILVNRSVGSDLQWGTPFVVPVARGTTVAPDDVGGVIALPGAIGVFWTNQATGADYFAVHRDGAPATDPAAWKEETAITGQKAADDHFNMKLASDGRLFVAMKTSRSTPADTLIGLLVRSPAGIWSPLYPVAPFSTLATRPLCVLDELHRRVYVFYSPLHATIAYKASSMDTIGFPAGGGTPFIASSAVKDIDNPTSTKQNVTPAGGIEVIASSRGDMSYWHNGVQP